MQPPSSHSVVNFFNTCSISSLAEKYSLPEPHCDTGPVPGANLSFSSPQADTILRDCTFVDTALVYHVMLSSQLSPVLSAPIYPRGDEQQAQWARVPGYIQK